MAALQFTGLHTNPLTDLSGTFITETRLFKYIENFTTQKGIFS